MKEKEQQEQQTGECEQAPKNKLTAREREGHEATHTCRSGIGVHAHCMMGRGRTHHHVSKKRSEVLTERPVVMDYHILKPNSTVNSLTIPEDRHQNIVSRVVLKKGIEEPWASERVARFVNSLGYKEITLKSDTEPAIIALRNRVAEKCNAEVTLEDAVKGDLPSNGWVENAVILLRGVIRTIKCHVESCTQEELREDFPILPWLVERVGCILSRCQTGRDGRTPFERLHGKKPTQEFVPFGEKVLARPLSSEPLNSSFVGTAEGVFRAREVTRMEHQDRWDKEAINNVIGVPWRDADGKWTVDRPVTQIDPLLTPPVPFEGARVQTERITGIVGTTAGCLPCRVRIEECLKTTPEGSERLDRRSEVLNEVLAKEVERNVRRREKI